MSPTLSQSRPSSEPGAAPSPRGLPAFGRLAGAAFAVNLAVAAGLLVVNRVWPAVSVVAGLVVGLAVYGSLHLFVGRGLEPLIAGVRGQAKPATGGTTMLFVCLLPLKYLVIGGLLYLLIHSGHVSLLWLGIGFLVTQAVVTAACVLHLVRMPRW